MSITPAIINARAPMRKVNAAQAPFLTFDDLPDSAYMRQPQVLQILPFSAATLWRKCKAGQFPKPVKLSVRVSAWRVHAVRDWLKEQEATAT
jgi:predicted DNA-binding transcriptional regulator AlpA